MFTSFFVLIINIVGAAIGFAGIVSSIILLSKKELKHSVPALILVFALWTSLVVASLTVAQEIENSLGNPSYDSVEMYNSTGELP